jgi:hypothetical protein
MDNSRRIIAARSAARSFAVSFLHKTAFYEHFRNTLAAHDFDYIDMQPAFTAYKIKNLRVSRFDPHTNAFANQLTADAIVTCLDAHPNYLHGRRAPIPAP